MTLHSSIRGVAVAMILAAAIPSRAADRSRELTPEERDALALASTEGPRLEPRGTRLEHGRLAGFDLERLRLAPVSELTRLVLDLLATRHIDDALAVIESLPVATAAEVLAAVVAPANLAKLSQFDADAVAKLLISNGPLLVALAQTSPDAVAVLLAGASEVTSAAILSVISNPARLDSIPVGTLIRLADSLATLADLSVRSDFDAEHLFATLAIKRASPGFTELSPESHFGVKLRELKAEAKSKGDSPEIRARITALYRDALEAISRKPRPPQEVKDGR
jgi:hypothetical protein